MGEWKPLTAEQVFRLQEQRAARERRVSDAGLEFVVSEHLPKDTVLVLQPSDLTFIQSEVASAFAVSKKMLESLRFPFELVVEGEFTLPAAYPGQWLQPDLPSEQEIQQRLLANPLTERWV